MAVNPFNDTLPVDSSFVGEPVNGAQAELRGIKNILKIWNPSTGGATAAAFLAIKNIFTKSQVVTPVALSSTATVTIDASTSNCFRITLGVAATTFAVPTNLTEGQQFLLRIKQDATGGRTYSFNSAFKFAGGTAPVPTTTANAVDVVAVWYVDSVLLAVQTADIR